MMDPGYRLYEHGILGIIDLNSQLISSQAGADSLWESQWRVIDGEFLSKEFICRQLDSNSDFRLSRISVRGERSTNWATDPDNY